MSIEIIIALATAVFGGVMAYLVGKDHAESERIKKELKSARDAKKVSDEQDAKSDDAVRSDAKRWVRSGKR